MQRTETAIDERRISIGALTLNLAFAGDVTSPPLLLLHGIGSRHVSWYPVVADLSREYRLLMPDLRGHGGSDKPDAGYLLPDYAEDLAALIHELGIERPVIIGHSLGALVALIWAQAHPIDAAALILEDVPLHGGAVHAPNLAGWQALAALPPEEAAAYYRREHPNWTEEECVRRAHSITQTHPAVFGELRDEAIRDGVIDRLAPLGGIQSPMLLIHGDPESGSMVRREDVARFERLSSQTQVARLAGGSHSLHRERTAEFLDLVRAFLERVRNNGGITG